MSKFGRQTTKADFLGGNKASFGQVTQSNKLGSSAQLTGAPKTKLFTLESGKVAATHHVIPAADIETKTRAHKLNPRNQKALCLDAVRKVIDDIRVNGIDTDCVGIWSDDNTTIEIIEGSVRRWCSIETEQSYPVWVLPAGSATKKDIRRLISSAVMQKAHSYRERGRAMMLEATELEDNAKEMKVNELAELLDMGRETVRKLLQAYKVSEVLIDAFPDCEGIPNSFYATLSRIEKILAKHFRKPSVFVDEAIKVANLESDSSVEERQVQLLKTMELLEAKIKGSSGKSQWDTVDIVIFDSKDKKVRKSTNTDGRMVKFEFSRIEKDLIDEIETLIKSRYAAEA
ncbi:ParB family protein [Pseudomonadota bacterium]